MHQGCFSDATLGGLDSIRAPVIRRMDRSHAGAYANILPLADGGARFRAGPSTRMQYSLFSLPASARLRRERAVATPARNPNPIGTFGAVLYYWDKFGWAVCSASDDDQSPD